MSSEITDEHNIADDRDRYKDVASTLYHARDFLRSSQVLNDYNQTCAETGDYPIFSVSVVNLMFAIELLLKTLLLCAGSSQRGHNIEKLFKALPAETQKEIEDAYDAYVLKTCGHWRDPMGIGFDIRLKQYAGAYEHWRYIHEKNHRNFNSQFCENLAHVLNEIAGIQESQLQEVIAAQFLYEPLQKSSLSDAAQ